jgi:ATP-dependent Clp protease ATP-binding subunit ClpA
LHRRFRNTLIIMTSNLGSPVNQPEGEDTSEVRRR